jgi:hypothetical protein
MQCQMKESLCCYERAQLVAAILKTACSTAQTAPAASAAAAAAPSRALLLLLQLQMMPQTWCVRGAGRLDTTLAAAARCSAVHAASTDMKMHSASWHVRNVAR